MNRFKIALVLIVITVTLTTAAHIYQPVNGKRCSGMTPINSAGLHKDSCGNIYLKVTTYNVQKPQVRDTLFLAYVYGDDFGTEGVRNLRDIIDIQSFSRDKNQPNIYNDNTHTYVLKEMYKSATLAIVSDTAVTK